MQLLKGHEGKKVAMLVNGHAVDAVVTVQWDYDLFPEIGDGFEFGDDEANKAYLARFENEELYSVVISVIARAEGIEGIDTLGGCHIVSRQFVNSIMECVIDHDMILNAINDLKLNILDAAQRLQRFNQKGA